MGDKEINLVRDFYQKLAEPERTMYKKLLAMDSDRRKVQIAVYITQGLFPDMNEDIQSALLSVSKMSDEEIVSFLAEKVRQKIERGVWAMIGALLSKLRRW